ncbi:probable thimet oligopeptidase isoform X2 [Aristolochia californica]|uniref:probable thimet oligopeptidase isoform X2 n=1 Tax=Aristolochia californica TaxID=171875 RepID=UPI0035D779EF
MVKGKKERRILAFTGAAALVAVAVNLFISAINSQKKQKKKELPGLSVCVKLSASEVIKLADHIIAKSKEVHDSVAAVPLDKVTYVNIILPLAELEALQFPLVQSCVFQKMLSPSADVRKASAEAERRIDAHLHMCSKREDVYRVVKSFAARGEWMSPETKQFVHCLVRDFERNGMSLTLSKREEIERLRNEIDELSLRFIHNLNDDRTFLLFNESELSGLPLEFIKSLERADYGKVRVTLSSHHVLPILEHCKVGATRRMVAMAQGQRCGEQNLHILESLVQLRHKLARLLGYSSYADYVIEPRMAKSSSEVFEFLEDLSAHLTELATRELCVLKELKKKEEGESTFGVEDIKYYVRRVEEQKFDLDPGLVKQYFPVTVVLAGLFKIFEDLFGLRFEEISEPEVWHGDVRLFSAVNLSSKELIGYFFLDLYSREGKYSHTCIMALQNGCISSNGVRQIPVSLLTANFQKHNNDAVVLLNFSEVVTLFHEFSHVIHHICNRASFARFSGLRVEPDFVEIPGQLLENWCYETSSLKLMSGFHQDISKPLPDEMCRKLKGKHESFSALKLKQELLLYNSFQ